MVGKGRNTLNYYLGFWKASFGGLAIEMLQARDLT